MITVDTREIKNLESDLKTFASRAYPFATRSTVNGGAFLAMREAKENVRESMTLRNKFTERSIRVDQEKRSLIVSQQKAVVGSTEDYMETQEFGGVETKGGKHGVAIATSFAAGQGRGAKRTRLPRKPNKLANIQLSKRMRGKSRKARNMAAVKDAAATKKRYIFMDLGRRKGIFKVTGGKRNPRVNMVWDLSRTMVVIPKNPWLAPAVVKARAGMPAIYLKALQFQARRHGLFVG